MDSVAHLAENDRRDLFAETAARLGFSPTVAEKDFWVCFTLKTLFEQSRFKNHLVFKGGTSLSKVYRIIERFSEDIDLVLDWTLMGFDPQLPILGSKTQQDKFNKQLNGLAAHFISNEFCPELNDLLRSLKVGLSAKIDDRDPHAINIRYPAAFSESYIRPEVRLEIGPLASWVPSSMQTIQPYASEVFPSLFVKPTCSILVISAERTFWEKATILHQESYRPGLLPQRYSRHYYDMYRLALSPVRERALSDLLLLGDVVEFKKRFYPCAWARYDLAVSGSFKLLGTIDRQLLEKDYQAMQLMLFGKAPDFPTILAELRKLEKQINELK